MNSIIRRVRAVLFCRELSGVVLAFFSLCLVLRGCAPLSKQKKFQTKINRDLLTRVFLRFRWFGFFFTLSSPGSMWYVSWLWLAFMITLFFRFTTVSENYHTKKNKKGVDKNCFCLFVLNRWSYGIVMWEVFTIGMWIFVKKNFEAT